MSREGVVQRFTLLMVGALRRPVSEIDIAVAEDRRPMSESDEGVGKSELS
jgi:hypothetical protein